MGNSERIGPHRGLFTRWWQRRVGFQHQALGVLGTQYSAEHQASRQTLDDVRVYAQIWDTVIVHVSIQVLPNLLDFD